VLEKDREYRLDRPSEKCLSIVYSKAGTSYTH